MKLEFKSVEIFSPLKDLISHESTCKVISVGYKDIKNQLREDVLVSSRSTSLKQLAKKLLQLFLSAPMLFASLQ